MYKMRSWLMCASMVLLTAPICNAQECYNCDGSSFGYPEGYSWGRLATHHQARKEKWHAWKAESAKIYARNDAWPKPFNCQDRMAYYSVWDAMIGQGYAQNCVLSAEYFDPETNELNQAGLSKIATVIQNLPSDRRQLLISRDANDTVTQARLNQVNLVVRTYHGQVADNMMVGLTEMQPSMMSGLQADTMMKRQLEGLPAPVIPVASIGSGVSGSQQQ